MGIADELPRVRPSFRIGNETYTVDMRLEEFRYVNREPLGIEFKPFDSPEGRTLWDTWINMRR